MTEGDRDSVEKTVRDTRRATRRKHNPEEKIRIVLEGLRGEQSIAELCRREGINSNLYYRWSKELLEAGNGWSNDAPPFKRTHSNACGRFPPNFAFCAAQPMA